MSQGTDPLAKMPPLLAGDPIECVRVAVSYRSGEHKDFDLDPSDYVVQNGQLILRRDFGTDIDKIQVRIWYLVKGED